MDRGRGDGQESEGEGGGLVAGGGPLVDVDVSIPPAKDIVDSLVSMGISRPVAEMVRFWF